MNIIIYTLVFIVTFIIIYLILQKERGALDCPTVGDLVYIRGPYDSDSWVREMREAVGARGIVIDIDKHKHYLVKVEDGPAWHFSASELVVL